MFFFSIFHRQNHLFFSLKVTDFDLNFPLNAAFCWKGVLIKFSLNTLESTPTQKIAIISGGETVVNIIGNGEGGRNQEFALSFLSGFESIQKDFDWVLLSVGTDGIDGPTDAAGGIIDDSSILKLQNQNPLANKRLDKNIS